MKLKTIYTSLLFLLFIFFKHQAFAEYDDGSTCYFYNGIPGCGCFCHCTCISNFISDKYKGGFPEDTIEHPTSPEDKVWHEFMKKILEAKKETSVLLDIYSIRYMLRASNKCGYVCLLSEYLNAIEIFKEEFEESRHKNIEWVKKIYIKPHEQDKLAAEIKRLNKQVDDALQILSSIPEKIIPLYKEIINRCEHNEPDNMVPAYNKGLIALLEGNTHESLSEILTFIDLAKKNKKTKLLTSELFQKQGEAFLEVNLYHQAIDALNKAISKDPKNLKAYFQRASAYFEIGNFDSSLSDYLTGKEALNNTSLKSASDEFIESFMNAAIEGSQEGAKEFAPSLCHTLYGLGQCLWSFGEHPIDSISHLANASYEFAESFSDFWHSLNQGKGDEYAEKIVDVFQNFNQLSDSEKGELIGYTIGKYGIDIFAGAASIKTVSCLKKLREANRACNLESMALSESSKQSITSAALKHNSQRGKFFEKAKIHWDRQNKHVPGKHNYKEGKSIFEHSNAEELLKNYGGTGTPKRGKMGQPGFQEVVDFKKPIGKWISEDGTKSLPTTKGTIHYSKDGAHIVPENPNFKVW